MRQPACVLNRFGLVRGCYPRGEELTVLVVRRKCGDAIPAEFLYNVFPYSLLIPIEENDPHRLFLPAPSPLLAFVNLSLHRKTLNPAK